MTVSKIVVLFARVSGGMVMLKSAYTHVFVPAIIVLIAVAGQVSAQTGNSSACFFTAGMRAGQIQDYAPRPPVPVGSQCHDGGGSVGFVVPMQCIAPIPQPQPQPQSQTSTLCQFDFGPRTGSIQDYAPQAPVPVGAPCYDGFGSFGKVVASGSKSTQTTQTCHFHTGPAAGKLQFFPNVPPAPVGIPCWDGASNNGITVPDQSSNAFSSNWDGNPKAQATVTAPPANAPAQPVPSYPTPLDVGKQCATSAGADPTAMGKCIVQNLPPNVAQQCLAQPDACFGKQDPVYWNLKVLQEGAKVLGVDLQKPAAFVDGVWGGVRDVLDFF